MKRTFVISIIAIIFVLSESQFATVADAQGINFGSFFRINNQNHSKVESNENLQIQNRNENKNQEETNEQEAGNLQIQNKEQTQLRIFPKENTNGNQYFMLKGVITATSSGSLTINNTNILIDNSVTGNVKIVGNVQTGAYAMVQGIIQNSNYYADKIVVDQRNNSNSNENEINEFRLKIGTPSAYASPSANFEQNENSTASAHENIFLSNLITRVQNLLTYLENLASKI